MSRFCVKMFLFLWDKWLRVELLGYMLIKCLVLWKTVQLFSRVAIFFCISPQQYMNGLFLFLKYVLFLYLTLLGLWPSLWQMGFLVAACGLQFPDQGPNPGHLHWELEVLATGLPGKSQNDPFSLHPHQCSVLSLFCFFFFGCSDRYVMIPLS